MESQRKISEWREFRPQGTLASLPMAGVGDREREGGKGGGRVLGWWDPLLGGVPQKHDRLGQVASCWLAGRVGAGWCVLLLEKAPKPESRYPCRATVGTHPPSPARLGSCLCTLYLPLTAA